MVIMEEVGIFKVFLSRAEHHLSYIRVNKPLCRGLRPCSMLCFIPDSDVSCQDAHGGAGVERYVCGVSVCVCMQYAVCYQIGPEKLDV